MSSQGFIYELIQQGRYVKVNAICTETGLEVTIVGDPKAPTAQLKRIAAMKLMRMLEKKRPKPLTPKPRGIIA